MIRYGRMSGEKRGDISTLQREASIVKAFKTTALAGIKGYDAAKSIQGRKRHILVDTLGLILVTAVTAANVPEREGARLILQALTGSCKKNTPHPGGRGIQR